MIKIEERLEPKDIFVSYSRVDTDKIQPIVNAIVNAGASLWIDTEAIDGAALWGGEIVKAITAAKVVLVAASPAAFKSHNVTKEICLASEKGKTILPIFLEPATIPPNVEYQLAGIQRIDIFRGEPEKNLSVIFRALRANGVDFSPPREIDVLPSGWVAPTQAQAALQSGDGKNIKVAIIDSGIEVTHPTLHGIHLIDRLYRA